MNDYECLKLSFLPDDIRQHYQDSRYRDRINAISDEELRSVALECIGGDIIYNAYCAALDLALGIREFA